MSPRKPEHSAREKCSTMSDEELIGLERMLKREIPAAQSLLSAVRRERKRRGRAARRWAA